MQPNTVPITGTPTRPAFAAKLDILAVFKVRAEARAYLWREGELDLPEAVDVLQGDAERDGLVARLGQDAVQQILAEAFHPVPATAVVYDPLIEQPRHLRAAAATVEAVAYALRERGITALRCLQTRSRIAELSQQQLEHVIARLARLRGSYPKVTDDLLLSLAELLDD